MTTETFDIGDLHKLSAAFKDSEGNAVNPGAVTFVMREPDGTETPYTYGVDTEVKANGTGAFYVEWTYRQPGRHAARWKGTPPAQAVAPIETYVRYPDLEAA